MTKENETSTMTRRAGDRCDVKVWGPSCERNEYANKSDKYLCPICGTIEKLDHEIGHDQFPHLKGDPDNMS